MTNSATSVDLKIRPYEEADEEPILELLRAALGPAGPGGKRTAEFFRWKHIDNPIGPSLMLVAEVQGRIVGFRAFMRWRFRTHERTIEAVRAVDTATHPSFQRMGIFSRLTRDALSVLREEEVDLVFNTPNEKSLPGYLKMGWQPVGRVPVWVRVRKPIQFLGKLRSLKDSQHREMTPIDVLARRADDVLSDEDGLSALMDRAELTSDQSIRTARSIPWLRWRYGSAPLLDYRVIPDYRDGSIRGLAIFRVRPRGSAWEATISELLTQNGDVEVLSRLIKRVAEAADVTYLTCAFPRGSSGVSPLGQRFLRSPAGITMVLRKLNGDDGIIPDPAQLGSWSISLGDVEVF